MTPEREMIVMAVLDGKLPESMLTKAGGKELPGLVKRRKDEMSLYLR